MRRGAGFTLLELLVAIAIFALVGLATHRMLESVLRADSSTRSQEQQLRALVRALGAFERDLLQVIPRPVRDGYADLQPALLAQQAPSSALEWTRSGWRNPQAAQRSRLQRVRWTLEGEQWQRQYWQVLDRAQDSVPLVQNALEGVLKVELRYLNQDQQWVEQWPMMDADKETRLTGLPLAVELRLEHRRFGHIRRLYRFPDGPKRQTEAERQAQMQLLPGAS